MSIRYSLLAILDAGPRHGYALKSEFEAATGNVWPLNVGQVYSTLSRLERDGLVLVAEEADGQKMYRISDAGRRDLRRWFGTPVVREVVPRQELAIKLVFATRAGPEQVRDVVQRQLVATMGSLQEFTRLKAKAEADGDLAWLMMLDALIFQAEAEVRWLELCEARLARARLQPRPGPEDAASEDPRPGDAASEDPRPGDAASEDPRLGDTAVGDANAARDVERAP
jgi:DNA-binding PadR family transcriptional regulator